jgi:hypothetical protein
MSKTEGISPRDKPEGCTCWFVFKTFREDEGTLKPERDCPVHGWDENGEPHRPPEAKG